MGPRQLRQLRLCCSRQDLKPARHAKEAMTPLDSIHPGGCSETPKMQRSLCSKEQRTLCSSECLQAQHDTQLTSAPAPAPPPSPTASHTSSASADCQHPSLLTQAMLSISSPSCARQQQQTPAWARGRVAVCGAITPCQQRPSWRAARHPRRTWSAGCAAAPPAPWCSPSCPCAAGCSRAR